MERAFNETPASPLELKSRPHFALGLGLEEGKGVLRFPPLLFKWLHWRNIGDSKLVFLSFHPLLEAVQSCFGPVLGGGEGRCCSSQQIGRARQVVAVT